MLFLGIGDNSGGAQWLQLWMNFAYKTNWQLQLERTKSWLSWVQEIGHI